jgi:carbon monoxide dehydrogenase subunit G
MALRVERKLTIAAPAERIFELITDPQQLGAVNPDIHVLSYEPSPAGGFDIQWEYRFGMMTLAGESRNVLYEKPHRVVMDTLGGVPSHWDWSVCQNGAGSQLMLALEYTVPPALAFMGKLLEKQNEKSVDVQMANIKRLAEENH